MHYDLEITGCFCIMDLTFCQFGNCCDIWICTWMQHVDSMWQSCGNVASTCNCPKNAAAIFFLPPKSLGCLRGEQQRTDR